MKHFSILDILPYGIAIFLTLLIIYLLPPIFEEYNFELVDQRQCEKEGGFMIWDDLDKDGRSEMIIAFENVSNKAAIKVASNNRVTIGQYNFDGFRPHNIECFGTFDVDNNQQKEIYLLTVRNDSVFLNYFEPMLDNGINVKDLFIDTLTKNHIRSDITFHLNFHNDFNNDHLGEIFVTIEAGFSLQPRSIYLINHQTKSIKKTPWSGIKKGILQIIQINDDSTFITTTSSAPSNYDEDDTTTYHDRSGWWVVFDQNLQYRFSPIEYPEEFTNITTVLVKEPGTERYTYISRIAYQKAGANYRKLIKRDLKGNIVKEFDLHKLFPTTGPKWCNEKGFTNGEPIIHFNDGKFYFINYNLEIVDSAKIEHIGARPIFERINIEGENRTLIVSKSIKGFRLQITNNKFKELANKDFHFCGEFRMAEKTISTKYNGQTERANLFVQIGREQYLLDFYENPYHPLRWFVYSGIFLMLVLFIQIIQKAQKAQSKKRVDLENQMLELQFTSMKAQLDPHFIFNILNSVSTAILKEDKKNAHRTFIKISDLLRSQVNRSREVTSTLKDELDFCRNYIEVQQFRFKNKFDYSIEVPIKVNQDRTIPKMIVQLFIENAIKHGIRPAEHHCQLAIRISNDNEKLKIEIDDNGIGREAAKNNDTDSTGKGMKLIDEMISIYQKLGHGKVHYVIIDKREENGNTAGTKAVVEIESAATLTGQNKNTPIIMKPQ